MITVAIASMFATAFIDTAASKQRAAFSACLKEAIVKAKDAKVVSDGFDAFARTHCATTEADLRKAVVAIDVKNGISRKNAAENADFELNDYFVSTAERYLAEVGPAEPPPAQAQAQAQAPAQPVPASEPKPQTPQ